ncbi:MAG: hypothetical protein PHV32_00265 [Eubacteriales bacterium]|nr:hypothetical protein [Eubacteriales bacterium]
MIVLLPFLVALTSIPIIIILQLGLPIWLPIVFAVILVLIMVFVIYKSFKFGKKKPLIIYIAIIIAIALVFIVFRHQIAQFVFDVTSPIGPGSLPEQYLN